MAAAGSTTEEIYLRLVRVETAVVEHRRGAESGRLAEAEDDLAKGVVAARAEGLEAILETERVVLRHELSEFVTSGEQESSLEAALEELDAARAAVVLVRDPDAYREKVDQTHRVRKHRAGGLPLDDARVFFAGHRARLGNVLKGPGTVSAKAVVMARRASMSVAERAYRALQQEALRIGDRGRGGR